MHCKIIIPTLLPFFNSSHCLISLSFLPAAEICYLCLHSESLLPLVGFEETESLRLLYTFLFSISPLFYFLPVSSPLSTRSRFSRRDSRRGSRDRVLIRIARVKVRDDHVTHISLRYRETWPFQHIVSLFFFYLPMLMIPLRSSLDCSLMVRNASLAHSLR